MYLYSLNKHEYKYDFRIIRSGTSCHRIPDKPKSHIYSDRIWYLKLYHFTLFMHFLVQLVQLVDLVWILHEVRDTAMVFLILGLLEHFRNI
jgi:hypothetical protein